MRWNSWTVITAANICGIWEVLYTVKSNRRSRSGLNLCDVKCDTGRKNEVCAKWPNSRNHAVKLAR